MQISFSSSCLQVIIRTFAGPWGVGAIRVVETECVNFLQRQIRALARTRHVEEQGFAERFEMPCDSFELAYALGCIDIKSINTHRCIGFQPLDRIGQAVTATASVRAAMKNSGSRRPSSIARNF